MGRAGGVIGLAFAAISLPREAVAEVRFIDTTKANCRQAPSLSALVLVQFKRNEWITVLNARRGWIRVDNGPPCWIRSWLVSREPVAEPRGRADAPADSLRRPAWFRHGVGTGATRRSSSGVGT